MSYLYNAYGQRVLKRGPPSLVASGALYSMYDEAGKLLGEYDANGAIRFETIYLGDVPVGVVKPGATSGATANAASTPNLYQVYADHLGAPRLITDTRDNIVWRWDSAEPFGASAPDQNPHGAGVFVYDQRLPGQVFDAETGLFDNWHRTYDARQGRYRQSDPIGLGGGINTYGYVAGQPTMLVDPTGEIPWWAVAGGVANGVLNGYQKYLDPCANWKDVAWAGAGGFTSGFVSSLIPITGSARIFVGGKVAYSVIGTVRALTYGAVGGYAGNQASYYISNGLSTDGLASNNSSAFTSAAMGAVGGTLGNLAGLGTALTNVASHGYDAFQALITGGRVGTAVGVLAGVADSATQFAPSSDGSQCSCRK